MDVHVIPEWSYGGHYHYSVWVNGEKYDEFTVSKGGWLTGFQMYDVAAGYREGLDGYLLGGSGVC